MKLYYSLNEINSAVKSDPVDYMHSCINEYQGKLDAAVDNILKNDDIDIIMLAGPSSSGKTTTAGKIADGIISRGKNAYIMSLDDFYFNRLDIPINSDGLPDYENITALDLPLIKNCFNSLIKKREAVLPVFNFSTGRREDTGRELKLKKGDAVIVEGIHAINPLITDGIDSDHIFKIYISVSSRVTVQGKVLLTKRNIRFVRRMIRDYNFRSSDVEHTYFLWSGVRKGEDRFIFPFKGNAQEFINTFHPFEPCLFRNEARELLSRVDEESPYVDEAKRLSEALERFECFDDSLLTKDSLLREFIG